MADAADTTPAPADQSVLTLADLNTTVNHEPRVSHKRLAKALGYADDSMLTRLADRHRTALERLGEVSVTMTETSKKGGRPGETRWFNQRQVLYLCAKSDMENATEVTIVMVEVFNEFLKGSLPPPRSAAGLVQVRGYTRALPKGPRPARPATAPLPRLDLDGFAIVRLGGEILVVDTNRLDIGPGVRAVTIGYKGSATVEDMTEGRKAGKHTSGLGDRNFTVPDVTNKVTGRRPFWVFGTVVASQPVARPEKAGETRESAPKPEAKPRMVMPAAVMARRGLAGLEVVGRA